MSTVVTATERLSLRHLHEDDAAFIFELMNDPDWLRYIGDRGIRTLDDAREYIRSGPMSMYARLGYGLYAVEPRGDGTPIGICGVLRRDWLDAADIGFAFLPAARRQGYAREAAAATLAHARIAHGMERILAIVSPGNEASIRLLEGLGFTFGRMARAADDGDEVCVYARSLSDS